MWWLNPGQERADRSGVSESPISEVGSRSPIPGPAHRPALRSYAEEIGRISQLLRENGALCVILVDASPLERIERTYGVEAYWRAIQELLQLVTEACREELGSDDIIASGDAGVDEIAIFVFRPREDDGFYRESLPALARTLTETFARNGNRIVYPYHREAPFLPVGSAKPRRGAIYVHPSKSRRPYYALRNHSVREARRPR